MFVFLMGYPGSADRDLHTIKNAGFSWGKTLIQWGQIELKGKGQYDWSLADKAVASAAQAGVRLIARVDYTPSWARYDHNPDGPPDNYNDFGDFINVLVNRYKTGSPLTATSTRLKCGTSRIWLANGATCRRMPPSTPGFWLPPTTGRRWPTPASSS